MVNDIIRYIDMFSGIGGFREGLTRAGGFECAGHCELDTQADRSYRALFDTSGEWYCADAKDADPAAMPDFELLCGGFPCQSFSIAGRRGGFGDPRGTLFFELARLAEARHPRYLLYENVPGLLNHDGGRTFAAVLDTLDRLGYGVEWQVLNSKDFGVPQARRRLYIVGYLDGRCAGKVFPFTETAAASLVQVRAGKQGERVYSPTGVSCTLSAQAGGFAGRTGLYDMAGMPMPVKEATKKGYKMAYPGDSIDLSYPTQNTRRGRVGRGIAHTLTASSTQGTLCPDETGASPYGRVRRLTPRECLRLQGWREEQIDKVLAIQSDNQAYKQAGNGVTVTVVEAIGRRLAAADAELRGVRDAP